jgi:hypothetical protein
MNRILRTVAVMTIAALALPLMAADDALSLVPTNAVTVGMVKLRDMRSSPLSGSLFEHTDKMTADGEAAQFLAEAGLAPLKDVDVLVVATAPRTNLGSEADVLVIAEGRFNVERLSAALISRGATKKGNYFTMPEKEGDNPAVAFLSNSLAVAGTERAVVAALDARAKGGTAFRGANGLGMDLARVDRNATAWALIDVVRASRLTKGGTINTGKGQQGEALAAAIRSVSTIAVWAKDTGGALELGAFGLSADGETLQLLEDTLKGALSAMRLAVRDKSPEMVSVLRRFEVTRKNDSIMIEGSIPASQLRELMAKKRAAK